MPLRLGKRRSSTRNDEAVDRQCTGSVEGNEAQHHQIIGEIDRLLVSRVDDRNQPYQNDRRDPRTCSEGQADQTTELDKNSQAGG